jgi:NitT/TauT family transport system substrate-binding protein
MKKIKNKKFVCIILCTILLISCQNNTSEKSDRIVKTATLKGPSAMAMIKMIEEKPFLSDTIPTKFSILTEPNQVKAMILNEEVDFAIVPSTMGAMLYNKTGKYILAAVPVWGTLYLFGTDSSIHNWTDLKGKKVSLMARGMTPDIMFRYFAERNGLDPDKDIKLDYSFPGHIDLANAIIAGITDLGVISEPLVSLAKQKNPHIQSLINFNEEWIKIFGEEVPFAQTALLVNKKLAESSPEIVDQYLDELEKSVFWVNNNKEKAAELIVEHDILPDKLTAIHSIPLCNLNYSQAWEEKEGIKEYFKVFYNFNPLIIGGALPNEDFYYQKKDI